MSTSTQLLAIAEAYDNYCASCRHSSSNSTARSNCNYKPYFLSQNDATRLTTIIRSIDYCVIQIQSFYIHLPTTDIRIRGRRPLYVSPQDL